MPLEAMVQSQRSARLQRLQRTSLDPGLTVRRDAPTDQVQPTLLETCDILRPTVYDQQVLAAAAAALAAHAEISAALQVRGVRDRDHLLFTVAMCQRCIFLPSAGSPPYRARRLAHGFVLWHVSLSIA
jgi:hypothetical protein